MKKETKLQELERRISQLEKQERTITIVKQAPVSKIPLLGTIECGICGQFFYPNVVHQCPPYHVTNH